MRQIGTIAGEDEARLLADYLLTLGITTRVNPGKEGWEVWVHREEKVEQGRRELAEFVTAPADPKYRGADRTAKALRKKAEQAEKEHVKNTIVLGGGETYRPFRRCPLTYALIWACVGVALLTDFGADHGPLMRKLFIAEEREVPHPAGEDAEDEGPRMVIEPATLDLVKRGEVWRLISPVFLHFGPIHLIFNMIGLFELGGLVEMRRGKLQLLLLVLIIGILSDLGQFFYTHSPYSGGMSGVIYGLLAYVWVEGRYNPEGGMYLRPGYATFAMVWLLACMTGALGRIGNAAHVVGLISGGIIGFIPHAGEEFRSG